MDRKALIREYKNTPREMGVYRIKNRLNGKVLIGASKNLPGILNRFRSELKLGSCRNEALQDEYIQYGLDVFEFSVLEVLEPLADPDYDPTEDLKFLLSHWCDKLTPYGDRGYNTEPKKCF
jgi:hypothetical protein